MPKKRKKTARGGHPQSKRAKGENGQESPEKTADVHVEESATFSEEVDVRAVSIKQDAVKVATERCREADSSISDSSSDDEEFGQKVPPLMVYLRGVLEKYPDGGQILKELLQNADDANAKNVIFMYDKTEYSFEDPAFDHLKGPSLYAYNDATFTKTDWGNIQNPEQSSKRKEPTKVGRFGLGFISVYHLTDLPSILSGKYLRILDPHENYFAKGQNGKSWKVTSKRSGPPQAQVLPFIHSIFHSDQNISNRKAYPSTIFRFPLRKEKSPLSQTLYGETRVEDLFKSFEEDAEISLLFLKSVESVSVYEKAGREVTPKLRFSVRISESCTEKVRQERRRFLDECDSTIEENVLSQLDFVVERHSLSTTNRTRYVMSSYLKRRDSSKELQELIKDRSLKLLPWVSVAMPITEETDVTEIEDNGRIFCFLPLPASEKPGFPVHVHGYFGLSDNRRAIKWPDKESARDKEAMWNELLASEVFPEVYMHLILQAKSIENISPNEVYQCWPSKSHIRSQWHEGITSFVSAIKAQKVLYTKSRNGRWVTPCDVVHNADDDPLLQKVLQRYHHPVATIPNHVVQILHFGGVDLTAISPSFVRGIIRNDPLKWLSNEERVQLLGYILKDRKFEDLSDICLLPLLSGSFVKFATGFDDIVYIPSSETPSDIIPGLKGQFASPKLPSELHLPKAKVHTQLRKFDTQHVASLLTKALPNNWTEVPTTSVAWNEGKGGHPTFQWLLLLWHWLRKNSRRFHLQQLQSIPLIPLYARDSETIPHRMAKLQPDTLIFAQNIDDSGKKVEQIPQVICDFLLHLGSLVIDTVSLPEDIQCHPEISSFILPASPEGVVDMLTARKNHIRYHMDKLDGAGKDILRQYLSQLGPVAIQSKRHILCGLPIFPSTSEGREYVDINSCGKMIPYDFHNIPVGNVKEVFIRLPDDDKSEQLLILSGVKEVSQDELLVKYIVPEVENNFFSEKEVKNLMEWVLKRSQYDDTVRSLKFIPDSNGVNKSPQELFDPACDNLRIMLGKLPVLPTGKYTKGNLLKHVTRVGWRAESDVTEHDILDVIIEIEKEIVQPNGNSPERAKALFQHLNHYPSCLKQTVRYNHITKPLWKFLEDKSWIPVEESRPDHRIYPADLEWYGRHDKLYRPSEVASLTTAALQGSTTALVNTCYVDQYIQDMFEWHDDLEAGNYQHLERVVVHLINAASTFNQYSDTIVYSKMIHDMYKFLDRANSHQLNHIFEEKGMSNVPYIWHGEGFTTCAKLALNKGSLRVSLAPYLYILPKSLEDFKGFFAKCGVKENFPEDSLCSVLHEVMIKNKEGNRTQIEIDDDLGLVRDILNCITNMLKPGQHPPEHIVVPCRHQGEGDQERLQLVDAKQCLYVDEQRLLPEYSRSGCDLPVIHQCIPTETAQRLGLQKLSHYVAPTETFDMGYDIQGPHETTVNAIRRNLDMYKEGLDVFKELIQNADDAQATEIKFLIDWRTNDDARTNLFDEAMEICHGPALWAFNNAKFSEEDVKNICSIAAATKRHELDKVGRFGLGFTSVYHITDVPSLVSGPFVLIFDPRTIHLRERVTPQQPGIKLDLRKEKHKTTLRSFSDQFKPFQGIFDCDIVNKQYYNHTLFRFPLRSELEAKNPAGEVLSEKVYQSTVEMDKLIKKIESSASGLLLFTQNIVNIRVYVLQDHDLPNEAEEILHLSVKKLKQLSRSIGGSNADLKTERNLLKVAAPLLEELPISERCQVQAEANAETSMILELTCYKKSKRKGKGLRKPSTKKFKYAVSSCLSTDEALVKARSDEGRHFAVVPCGGVAALLTKNEPKETEGQAFCFLPLDVGTGLPFHINGTFLLQPNRRQLWTTSTSNSADEFEALWNICLMETVILKALLNLLSDLKLLHGEGEIDASRFQTLWPRFTSAKDDLRSLVDAFYKALCSQEVFPTIIYNGSRWVSLQNIVFTTDLPNNLNIKKAAVLLLNRHCHPKKYVEFDSEVLDSIALEKFKENTYDWKRFIFDVFVPLMNDQDNDEHRIEADHRNNIVLQLLDDRIGAHKRKIFDTCLQRTQCIPISMEDEIRSPLEVVNPNCDVGKLFRKEDKRFPCGEEFLDANRLHSLAEIGMAMDDLSWEDVCERAEFVQCKEGFHETSQQRSLIILRLINRKLKQMKTTNSAEEPLGRLPTDTQVNRLKSIRFLPVMTQPEEYPFPWFVQTVNSFASADDIYEASNVNLLGCVCPLLDEEFLGQDTMTDALRRFLGIKDKEPPVGDVMRQLEILTDTKYQEDCRADMLFIFKGVYDFLQRHFTAQCTESGVRVKDEFRDHIERLKKTKFLFIDGAFVSCRQLAFTFVGSCDPYLYRVPNSLTPFANLLQICGVRNCFEPRDYLVVLKELRHEYSTNRLGDDGVKLAVEMIEQVVSIVTEKVGRTFQGSIKHDEEVIHQAKEVLENLITKMNDPDIQLLAPDQEGILRPISDLTFKDMWWIDDDPEWAVPHDSLPLRSARILGMKTAKETILEECSTSDGFESDFGQSEDLTVRIKGLLRDYNKVSDVMKELLQNADDAQATEIHFVYDPRTHPSQRIIDKKKWAKIQELPALCVYNNKPFTKEDIRGIQKVGVGGKLVDKSTAGRFGVGFNAVYHLTDCPSFISNNEQLCIFDPHAQFVPGAKRGTPGKKYCPLDKFEKKFPDMLQGYLRQEFNLTGATMFRFPLRSQAMARTSQISDKCYDDKFMVQLLQEFEEIAKHSMYFLRHIKNIYISEISQTTNKLQTRYVIESKLLEKDANLRQLLTNHIHEYRDSDTYEIPQMTQVYSLQFKDSQGMDETWLVAQTIGLETSTLKEYKDKQQRNTKRQLPLGGVAALISSNRPDCKNESHKVFCFLPLPIVTKLPVHINGAFALDTSRRYFAKDDTFMTHGEFEENCLTHKWNRLLIENVVTPAYAALIDGARNVTVGGSADISQQHIDIYYDLFPSATYDDWDLLAKSTLTYIGNNALRVLPVIRNVSDKEKEITWHQPMVERSRVYFDNLCGTESQLNMIRSFLLKIEFKLVAPGKTAVQLCKSFQNVGVTSQCINPEVVLKHLAGSVTRIAQALPCPIEKSQFLSVQCVQVITKYCFSSQQMCYPLNNVPLKVTNDGVLNLLSNRTPVFITKYFDLLPTKPHLFIHESLVSTYEKLFDLNSLCEGTIKPFTLDDVNRNLQYQLPPCWNKAGRHVIWTPGENGNPTEKWLKRLWEFISQRYAQNKAESILAVDWPIIPTNLGTLVSPRKGKTVLYLKSSPSDEISEIFNHLHCPNIALHDIGVSMFSYSVERELVQQTCTSFNDRDDVLTMFEYIMVERSLHGILNDKQSHALLLYFQSGYTDKNASICKSGTLKKLPIFKLKEGGLSSINGYRNCHTCHSSLPTMQRSRWMETCNCIFLQPDFGLATLYEKLYITLVTDVEVYTRYILQSFRLFDVDSKLYHLRYIANNIVAYLVGDKRDSFLYRLKCSKIIPDLKGNLRCASSFYDRNAVFEALIDPIDLLPLPFTTTTEVHNLLSLVELQSTVTEELFRRFAKEIQKQSEQISQINDRDKLYTKSRILLEELSRNTALWGQDFLKEISEIKFIPPLEVDNRFVNLHPEQKGRLDKTGSSMFIAYLGAVPESCLRVAWTSAKVLPAFASFGSQEQQEYLGISRREIDEHVVKHARNVCFKMVKFNCIDREDKVSSDIRRTMVEVSNAILDYFKDHCRSSEEDALIKKVRDIPICVVDNGRILVYASQIVFRLNKSNQRKLRPYLYMATEQMAHCENFLRLIGATPSPTPDQLAHVLSTIKSECGNGKMHPNELQAAHLSVRLLFNILKQNPSRSNSMKASTLYLPDTKRNIRHTTDLCCANSNILRNLPPSFFATINLVVSLKMCGVTSIEDVQLLSLLPKHLQPRTLCDSIIEKPCPSNQDCPAGNHCPFLIHIKRLIVSEELQRAINRLLRHQMDGAELTPKQLNDIARLRTMNDIRCVQKLDIELVDEGGSTLSNKPMTRRAFLVNGERPVVFLQHCGIPVVDCLVYRQLAQTLDQICGLTLNDIHLSLLREVISASDRIFMNRLLTEADIPEYGETSDDDDPFSPGRVVPGEYHTLLDANPYNRFHEDEVVAHESPPRLSGPTFTIIDNEPKQEYLFARIVREVKTSGSHLEKRYKIDIGGDRDVNCTSLYKFYRINITSEQAIFITDAQQAEQHHHGGRELPADTLEEAKEWITHAMEDAFHLNVDERKVAIRRLLRLWHPDKNRGKEQLADEAFKFLQQEIKRFDNDSGTL